MSRLDRAFVRLLMWLYPRWLRRERGDELLASYEDLLRHGDARGRGRPGLVLWLVRDAVVTGVRARLRRSRRASGSQRSHETSGRHRHGGDGMMSRMMQDLMLALRSLRRSPGFALVAVVTMGLGIGLNSAVFGIVHSVLLRPLPYDEPDELVRVDNRYLPSGGTGWVSGAEYWELRTATSTFDAMLPLTPDAANLTGLPTPLRVQGLMVAPGFFEMLGRPPALGRGFLPDEGRPGGEPVVVLGHGLWQTAFGADPDVLGRTIQLGGRSRRVVGVTGTHYAPISGYLFTGRPEEYFVPVVLDPATFDQESVERHNLLVLGRLAADVEPEAAERVMLEAVRRLELAYPGISNEGSRDVAVTPVHEAVVGPVRGMLLLLAGAAGLVLLVACVNVANLLLARADTRTSEMAVRAAIGAGRGRLVWHGVAESVVVGLLGGTVGLALTLATRESLVTLVPSETPMPQGIALGAPMLAFTLLVALLAGAVAGLVPAIQLGRGDVFGAIKVGGGDKRGPRRSALRRGLVVAQVAGAVVLVTSAALLLRSLNALQSVDTGFDVEGLYGVQVSATRTGYAETADVSELYRLIESEVAALPGIESVAASWQTPLQQGMSDWPVMPRREGEGESEWFSADPNLVGIDFFATYGVEVVAGRGFEAADAERPVAPVILNRSAARRLFGDGPAVGRQVNLDFGDPVWREVVGVVEDVRGRGLAQDPRVQTYTTFGSSPWGAIPSLVLNIRSSLDPGAIHRSVTDVVRGVDPEIPVGPATSMESVIAGSIEQERVLSFLLAIFATVALVLGAIGVYGVVSYSVGRRTREIGLRMAVGAERGSVLGLVVRQGMLLGAFGVALGVVGAVGAGGVLEGFLFGVSETDPATIVLVGLGMLAVTGLASFLPARRAASVDPLTALRD